MLAVGVGGAGVATEQAAYQPHEHNPVRARRHDRVAADDYTQHLTKMRWMGVQQLPRRDVPQVYRPAITASNDKVGISGECTNGVHDHRFTLADIASEFKVMK
jgi:hypothetical protein